MQRLLWLSVVLLVVLSGSLYTETQASGPVQQNSELATTYDAITRVREGPSLTFSVVYELPPVYNVQALALSSDQQWVLISDEREGYGWAAYGAFTVLPPNLPVLATPPVDEVLPYNRCIAVVGDSVVYGDITFLVPGHGFPVARTAPISHVLWNRLAEQGMNYFQVRDRSVPAAYLSPLGPKPYRQQPEYQALLNDGCQFIMIFPWINDLIIVREEPAASHILEMEALLLEVSSMNPTSQIIVMGYYYNRAQDFVHGYDTGGLLDDSIDRFNTALFEACAPGGRLSQIPQVHCMPTAQIFIDDVAGTYVAQDFTREQFNTVLFEPVAPENQALFDVYWQQNPQGVVTGDGVHLSEVGKALIVEAMIEELLWLEPDM